MLNGLSVAIAMSASLVVFIPVCSLKYSVTSLPIFFVCTSTPISIPFLIGSISLMMVAAISSLASNLFPSFVLGAVSYTHLTLPTKRIV